jgi:hypothetical protein
VIDGFTSPLKKVMLQIYVAFKNPSSLAGFEPANLVSNGWHANHQTTGRDSLDVENNVFYTSLSRF